MIPILILAFLCSLSTAKRKVNLRLPPDTYVALGDSYAAGLGAGHHLKTDDPYDDCLLYNESYPQQFHTQIQQGRGRRLKNLACAREYVTDFYSYTTELLHDIPKGTSLISVQFGLDHVRIYNPVKFCDERNTWSCSKSIALAETRAQDRFYSEMLKTVRKLRSRANDALIVVLGYPRFYGIPTINCNLSGKGNKGWWGGIYRDKINAIPLQLNEQLANVVSQLNKEGNKRVVFKNPDDDFAEHRYCDQDPWFISYKQASHNVKWAFFNGYFHPNIEGHKKHMELLDDAWQNEGLITKGACAGSSPPGYCTVSDDGL